MTFLEWIECEDSLKVGDKAPTHGWL